MAAQHRLTSKGAELADLEAAAADRLLDTDALFASDRFAAAVAAGIYALEITLKVRICRLLRLDFLPRAFEIHELDGLLILTGLESLLNGESIQKPVRSKVKRNWDEILLVSKTVADLRYFPDNKTTRDQAEVFRDQLTNTTDGVLSWLSNQA